jgi:hypothetical protein
MVVTAGGSYYTAGFIPMVLAAGAIGETPTHWRRLDASIPHWYITSVMNQPTTSHDRVQ